MLLFFLTLMHFAVDGCCGAALADHATVEYDYTAILRLFALYNLVAFGGQWLAGLALDKRPRWIGGALPCALLLLGAGTWLNAGILAQALCLGAGNCLFHAAGGSLVLRRFRTCAEPGVFVSSGAVGLALGLNGFIPDDAFLAVCAVSTAALLLLLRRPGTLISTEKPKGFTVTLPLLACLLLLLGCVTLRGFGGGGRSTEYALLFPCVFMLGKAAGGFICDKMGWGKTVLGVFLLSFLALQIKGLPGALLLTLAFNMTMPLTLWLTSRCLPHLPGLAFGLTAGCLLPGAFLNLGAIPAQAMAVAVFILLSAAGMLFEWNEKRRQKQESPCPNNAS
ncbi:MAG: hypothetical protein IKX79_01880 [Desulfovibrionaceae bacterium]|nr:hypothetical protein [Desulfovibrionaceae bacterium]